MKLNLTKYTYFIKVLFLAPPPLTNKSNSSSALKYFLMCASKLTATAAALNSGIKTWLLNLIILSLSLTSDSGHTVFSGQLQISAITQYSLQIFTVVMLHGHTAITNIMKLTNYNKINMLTWVAGHEIYFHPPSLPPFTPHFYLLQLVKMLIAWGVNWSCLMHWLDW